MQGIGLEKIKGIHRRKEQTSKVFNHKRLTNLQIVLSLYRK